MLQLNIYHAPVLGANQETHQAVLSVTAGKAPGMGATGPIALGLVLDRSASMKLPMLACAKDAAQRVIDLADESVVLTAIAFSDEAVVLEKPGPCTREHKAAVKRALGEIRATGGTAISRALEAVIKQIGRYRKHRKRILLLTDGRNCENRQRFERIVAQCADEGFEITAWGLGLDWDEKDLQFMAHNTGGSCDLILDPRETARAFAASFEQMQKTAVGDVRAIIQCSEGVRVRTLRQTYPNLAPVGLAWDGDRCVARLGSLAYEETRAYLLESSVKETGSLKFELAYSSAAGESLRTREELDIRREGVDEIPPHPFVTHYLRQEELSLLATEGRLAMVEGDAARATQLLRRALNISQETGNDYLTKLLSGLLQAPMAGAETQLIMGTRKTLALHSGKTVFHETAKLEAPALPVVQPAPLSYETQRIPGDMWDDFEPLGQL